ncbi:MAG: bifunctional proline dehydrogenase/L-glutamate gamma-semialdehyde dehydrogenase PutA [Burkholderiaceae bacterium]
MSMHTIDPTRSRLRESAGLTETDSLARLLADGTRFDAPMRGRIHREATDLVRRVRAAGQHSLMERFLTEYGLSSTEGVGLMCLAEALLRVPDADTIDELIRDKIEPSDWGAHLGRSSSSLVNASTWALMLTGRLLDEDTPPGPVAALRGLVRRVGEPVVRIAVGQAMKTLGAQFVLGQTIDEAHARGAASRRHGYTYSYDMLGEAARTAADARRYRLAYAQALHALTPSCGTDIRANPGISVKLSALHPRYEYGQRDRVMAELVPATLELARLARAGNMGLNIDAEEADRLELSLDVIEAVLADPSLAGWDGFGVVVQAYGLRAPQVIDWLHALAMRLDRRIMVRLVKGAYWDTEIKHAQELGLAGFPVYTAKAHTDVSYLVCAEKLLGLTDRLYPQFATHNAHSCAAILALADDYTSFEFQRLHGMGESLHRLVMQDAGTRCRIYAPVGAHRDLLAYLVRRLLENGANSSFVNQIANDDIDPALIAADPFAALPAPGEPPRERPTAIRAPRDLFAPSRVNSRGWDLTDPLHLEQIDAARAAFADHRWRCEPLLGGAAAVPKGTAGGQGQGVDIVRYNPAHRDDIVGSVRETSDEQIDLAFAQALAAWPRWHRTSVAERAAALRRAADALEANAGELFALCTREAGKTLRDGVAEVREAVDFLRYYAAEAGRDPALGDAGGRGVFVCISPWNFPLAIFCGQVAAALVAGNAVLAKPAEQSPLIAARAVQLLHEAGIPRDILQLLPGDGPRVGARLTADPRLAGVVFTGSTQVAQLIHRAVADNAGPDAVLIAETGGLNAMIVDSTALPEQVVRDVVISAFQSSGQRCSALRVLYVQSGIAQRLLEMLAGAMDELRIGDPWVLSSDIGPVIDRDARDEILAYREQARREGRLVKSLAVLADIDDAGWFVPPCVISVPGIAAMPREIFGPVLHLVTFEADQLDAVVDAINARGFGLTFGLHTRIDDRVQQVTERIRVGNIYVNRNQIGAVVGSQPFGGEGLSGTGPKAGGPHYLGRFVAAPPVQALTPRARPPAGQTGASSDPSVGGSAEPVSPARLLDALRALCRAAAATRGWAVRTDRARLLHQGLHDIPAAMSAQALAALAAAGQMAGHALPLQSLPGPTGESNRLGLHARETTLCLGPTAAQALAQAAQALFFGGAALIVCPQPVPVVAVWRRAGAPVEAIAASFDPDLLAGPGPLGLVAFASDASDEARVLAGRLRKVLAARDGELIGLATEVISPIRFLVERHQCIDTTAAGGNASLLAAV